MLEKMKEFWFLSRELEVEIGLFSFFNLVLQELGVLSPEEFVVSDPHMGLILLKTVENSQKIKVGALNAVASSQLMAFDPIEHNVMVGYLNAVLIEGHSISRDVMFVI